MRSERSEHARRELEQTRRPRGLVSSRVSGARVDARTAAPTHTSDVVRTYWSTSWDLRGEAPHVAELVADPCITIAFEKGASRIVGPWTKKWSRTLEGSGRIRAAKLSVGAARAVLDAPAHRFTDRVLPLESVLGEVAIALEREVLTPTRDAEGFEAIERWILERRASRTSDGVRRAVALCEEIARDATLLRVEHLVMRAGLSVRAIQVLFREHVGVTPKWMIRVRRLQEAAGRIERGEHAGLAALAAELGYADQAHFTRDFKSVVGQSPSAFAEWVHR